jgi:hypothetical protein
VRWPPASELVGAINELVLRQSPASKDTNTESEEATALETVTRQQSVKIHITENS